jgi:hypothetical protein
MKEQRMKKVLLLIVPLFVSITGCSEEKSATDKDDASFSGMVDSQTRAMQKAKDIEGVLMDAEKNRREANGQ